MSPWASMRPVAIAKWPACASSSSPCAPLHRNASTGSPVQSANAPGRCHSVSAAKGALRAATRHFAHPDAQCVTWRQVRGDGPRRWRFGSEAEVGRPERPRRETRCAERAPRTQRSVAEEGERRGVEKRAIEGDTWHQIEWYTAGRGFQATTVPGDARPMHHLGCGDPHERRIIGRRALVACTGPSRDVGERSRMPREAGDGQPGARYRDDLALEVPARRGGGRCRVVAAVGQSEVARVEQTELSGTVRGPGRGAAVVHGCRRAPCGDRRLSQAWQPRAPLRVTRPRRTVYDAPGSW